MAEKAFQFSVDESTLQPLPVMALVGDDLFLKRLCLQRISQTILSDEDDEFSRIELNGKNLDYPDLIEELSIRGLFGSSSKLVIVDPADEFVSKNRDKLEKYLEKPKKSSNLVLMLKTLPSNTRLYKKINANGILVDCKTPSGKGVKEALTWMAKWAQQKHQVKIGQNELKLLVDIVGLELGIMDQEIAKLAVMCDDNKITMELIEDSVGGWRAKTTWSMLDAAVGGDSASALKQLDLLFTSGEHPIALLGQISASLRKYAATTRLIISSERAGNRMNLRSAMKDAGINPAPFILEKSEKQLRKLGRHRGKCLYRWLEESDIQMKGDSALPPRVVLEKLIVQIAHQPAV